VDFLLVIIELFSIGVMAEVLRANIDRKSAFFKGMGHFGAKCQAEGDVPHQPLVHRCRWQFSHKMFVAHFLRQKCSFTPKTVTYVGRP